MVRNYTIFPNRRELQDSSKSIVTEDSTYDFENFSSYEENIILSVLDTTKKKYPPIYRAIGLANESCEIVYKPRYVLFEAIIQIYSKSTDPLDNLAVAIAYETKGARFRSQAIEHFEHAIKNIPESFLDRFFISMPFSLFLRFSKVYEKEHEFEKALYLTKMAAPYSDLEENPLEDRKTLLNGKIENPPKRRKRKPQERDLLLDKKISCAARYYIKKSNFLK